MKIKFSKKFPLSDWKYEVENGDTKLGYSEWLRHKIDDYKHDVKLYGKGGRPKTNPRRKKYRVRKNFKRYGIRKKISRRKKSRRGRK